MREQAARLDGLLRQAHAEWAGGWLDPARHRALLDLVDGHRLFDPGIDDRLPEDAWRALRGTAG